MRLIETSTLHLVNKHDMDVPPYAILSHTWGSDEEEVSFQELRDFSAAFRTQVLGRSAHPVARKKDFAKIRDSARLAASQGLDYIWIDTCCIDKTSSAELSEAINSMFRWYRNSRVCYAYLSDVVYELGPDDYAFLNRGDEAGSETSDEPGIVKALRASRWFRRGWTLQELIAPVSVDFYSKTWNLLGTKLGAGPSDALGGDRVPDFASVDSYSPTSMWFGWMRLRERSDALKPDRFPDLISSITGIDTAVLKGHLDLEELSVASRMKWAAYRETTRVEDKAYCLMGIFGVNMPLLYGEGDRAFIRLQEEILKSTDDQSIFAWRCPSDDPLRFQLSGLLASSALYFAAASLKPRSQDTSRVSAPFTMTNAGLHVRLYLRTVVYVNGAQDRDDGLSPEYYGVLDCASYLSSDGEDHNAAILLTSLGGDQYSRVYPDTIVSLPSHLLASPEEGDGYRYVYIKQLPTYGLPDIDADFRPFAPQDLSSIGTLIRVIEVYPIENWNKQAHTLKSTTMFPNTVLGAFRYALVYPYGQLGDVVDILVGLARGYRGPRMVWCIQKKADDHHRTLTNFASEFDSSKILRKMRITPQDQHPLLHVLAKVEFTWAQNRPRIRLSLSEIHEIGGIGVLAEIDSGYGVVSRTRTSRPVTAFVEDAEAFVLEESWDTALGFSMSESRQEKLQKRIRVQPEPVRPRSRDADSKSLRQLIRWLRHPVEICLEQDSSPGQGEDGVRFPQYFSLLLARACVRNDMDAVTELLRSPLSTAAVDVPTCLQHEGDTPQPWHSAFRGFRPLHWAVLFGHRQLIGTLLAQGADVLSTTAVGLSAIHLAILGGRSEFLKDLLEEVPADWEEARPEWFEKRSAQEPMAHLVASYVASDVVQGVLKRFLRKTGDDGAISHTNALYNTLHETPLHRAAANRNLHAVKAILALVPTCDIDLKDRRDRTPLWHAAAAGASDIVKLLLLHSADPGTPDVEGWTPLHAACRGGHAPVVTLLFEAGVDESSRLGPGRPPISPFHLAVLSRDAETLRAFLDRGQDPNEVLICSNRRITPLDIAVSNGSVDCVQILHEAGCDLAPPRRALIDTLIVDSICNGGMVTLHGAAGGIGQHDLGDLALLYGHTAVYDYIQDNLPVCPSSPESSTATDSGSNL